jgi:hypothetical protein
MTVVTDSGHFGLHSSPVTLRTHLTFVEGTGIRPVLNRSKVLVAVCHPNQLRDRALIGEIRVHEGSSLGVDALDK